MPMLSNNALTLGGEREAGILRRATIILLRIGVMALLLLGLALLK